MDVYLNVFVVLFALAALDVYFRRRDISVMLLVVGALILILLAGLRWETGNDWRPYLAYYEGGYAQLFGFEPGYRMLVHASQQLSLDYTGFLLLSATIYMTAFAIVFARFRHPAVLMLLFYCIYLLGFMGTQRQTLALGFTSIAMLSFYDRKRLRGIASIAVATLFHYTAIIAVLALLVPRWRLGIRTMVAGMLAAVLLYHFDVAGALVESVVNATIGDGYLARRLLAYSADGEWVQAAGIGPLMELLWLMKRIGLVVVFWWLCARERPSLDNYLVNLYALSVFLFLTTFKGIPLLALRGPLYFGFFEIVLTYLALQRVGGWLRRETLLLIGGALAAARLYAGIMLYAPDLYVPYKSVLVNADFARFMH